MVQEKPKAP